MKKRMLVTTIALVLVIAVALTTSSLAWFSSSSAVTTGEVTFTAAPATGANLVLGDLGDYTLDDYDTTEIELPGDTGMYPAQGLPTLGALVPNFDAASDTDFTAAGNQITYKTNPFLKADKVEQTEGFAVADQKVKLVEEGDYLAGGFNYANATGDELKNGVTVKATITLDTVDADVAATGTTVNKGYIAYVGEGVWKSAGQEVTGSPVFFEAQDVALLASIRIAMFNATNVVADGTTFGAAAAIYDFDGTGVVLTRNGYAVGTKGSNNQYANEAGDDVTMPTGNPYGTIKHITIKDTDVANGIFTFTETFSTKINAGDAGSIAYVIWMDGWDESALPGVSLGTFGMTFEVSASSVAA